MNELLPGTQVVYVPNHLAEGELTIGYPNGCQPGFVTEKAGVDPEGYFVRYWWLDGETITEELRTKANSELTYRDNLAVLDSVPQDRVDRLMVEFGYA
jgi:hypothetical protein